MSPILNAKSKVDKSNVIISNFTMSIYLVHPNMSTYSNLIFLCVKIILTNEHQVCQSEEIFFHQILSGYFFSFKESPRFFSLPPPSNGRIQFNAKLLFCQRDSNFNGSATATILATTTTLITDKQREKQHPTQEEGE